MPDGDGRRAMRETGVGSPTTACRWIEAWNRQPTADWHLLRAVTPRIRPEIAERVIVLLELAG
jgi:hypothetical protein